MKPTNSQKELIVNNYNDIQNRVRECCKQCGRDPKDVSLLAAIKTRSISEIRAIFEGGCTLLGENRLQEAIRNHDEIRKWEHPIDYHFIGHLQKNKVKDAVKLFDCIESVDSFPLAIKISDEAIKTGKNITIFLQVNVSGEPSKFGIAPQDALKLFEECSMLPNLVIAGAMTIGANTKDSSVIRSGYQTLASLARSFSNEISSRFLLSMGMSSDLEIAIEEGANIVRIGTAIFGDRG